MTRTEGNGSRKVIAFDSWTGGVSNIDRLVDAFAHRGLDVMLIHIGSWGHDPDRAKEERIGKLLVRDISFYGSMTFREILRYESPAAVLFLSTQAFAHRAMNRYCAEFGIPTLHLYHGLVRVQCTTSKRLNPLNIRRQLALCAERLGKNLTRIWPVYSKALWETRAPLKDWGRFAYDVWLQATGRSYVGRAAGDASTTACCVYTDADVSHAVERYGVPGEAVFVVGNPDLVKFGLKHSDLGAALSPGRPVSQEVMYIDTSLIEAGSVFESARDFVLHLRKTAETLTRQGYRLVVKLHPAHSRTGVSELVEAYGIEQCQPEKFVERLRSCAGAIVEPSTAALIPALLGLPLLLAQYGKLARQAYGEVLSRYPRGRLLRSIDDVVPLISEIESHQDVDSVWEWIHENAGPLPAEEIPERVARVLETMLCPNLRNQFPAGAHPC